MTIKSAPYYFVVCDGCGKNAQEGQEFTAWSNKGSAVDGATDADWLTTEDGRHWCEEDTTGSDAEDERVPTDAALASAAMRRDEDL